MEPMERRSAEELERVLVEAAAAADLRSEKQMVRPQVQEKIWEALWRGWTRKTDRSRIVCFGWQMRPGSPCAVVGSRLVRASKDTAFRMLSQALITVRPGHIKTRRLLRHAVGMLLWKFEGTCGLVS
jgi:hypothetical protein